MGMDGRGFRRFDIGGDTICVDTTDFAKVEDEKINAKIDYALSNV